MGYLLGFKLTLQKILHLSSGTLALTFVPHPPLSPLSVCIVVRFYTNLVHVTPPDALPGLLDKVNNALGSVIGRSSPVDGMVADKPETPKKRRRLLAGRHSEHEHELEHLSSSAATLSTQSSRSSLRAAVELNQTPKEKECLDNGCHGAFACMASDGKACSHKSKGNSTWTLDRCERKGRFDKSKGETAPKKWCGNVASPVPIIDNKEQWPVKAVVKGIVVFAPVKGTSAKLGEILTVKWHQQKLDEQYKKKKLGSRCPYVHEIPMNQDRL